MLYPAELRAHFLEFIWYKSALDKFWGSLYNPHNPFEGSEKAPLIEEKGVIRLGCERGSYSLRPSEPAGGMGVMGAAHTPILMVSIVQLVRTPDCDSGGRGFESLWTPNYFLRRSHVLI